MDTPARSSIKIVMFHDCVSYTEEQTSVESTLRLYKTRKIPQLSCYSNTQLC